MIPPDNGHPPRQPRSDVAPQAVPSPSLGSSIISKTYSQYPRHPRHPNAPRSLADGRGRGGFPMAAGTKRRASSPRAEPASQLEIPPKRPSPSTWPTASPIRCSAVQGENVAIRAITFNGTGKLMAVTCER
ncbi:hypothetical protein BGY98DRAFT_394528 [Russula aff. rugulosa BPL654]|nr:hypothetical protein BGY98DRAFT_394528 [Russula aff. rugulosa BPL654]